MTKATAAKRSQTKRATVNQIEAVESLSQFNEVCEVIVSRIQLNTIAINVFNGLSDCIWVWVQQCENASFLITKTLQVSFVFFARRDPNDARLFLDAIEKSVCLDDGVNRIDSGYLFQIDGDWPVASIRAGDDVYSHLL